MQILDEWTVFVPAAGFLFSIVVSLTCTFVLLLSASIKKAPDGKAFYQRKTTRTGASI
jgi:hypothetical protein